jgi:uncharacterized protein (DUF952 family)
MAEPDSIVVFKICPKIDWNQAALDRVYRGSPDDRRDGYIHLSAAHQLPGTLARHFARQTDLLLIAFDAAALGEELKWEPSPSGELYPHLYGTLSSSLALWVRPIPDENRETFLRGFFG